MKNSDDSSCLELAREGERLIRENNFQKGIEFLERAISVGTGDLQTLSAIYSQLGNAFFSIRSYSKALEYHNNDLLLARLMSDKMGEAKACGNLGNTWKALGGFNDAIMFIERQLELARLLNDKMLEARALFHLGTSYQMRGKQLGKRLKNTHLDLPSFNLSMTAMQPFTEDLEKSIVYFKENLRLSEELHDELACGRIYGHLGNTYYLLRDYATAIHFHYKRLETARQFGDKNAMRRAYTNLANAHVFLPNMEKAVEFYRLALSLAYELRDKLAEAQSCFSLANAAALVHDYHTASEYHNRHLTLARECVDRAGEARAYASLAVDYKNIGDLPKAAYFYLRNRQMAKEMSDVGMISTANDGLRQVLLEGGDQMITDGEVSLDSSADPDAQPVRLSSSLHSLYDDGRDLSDCGLTRYPIYRSETDLTQSPAPAQNKSARSGNALSQEEFFDLLSKMQSKRLDEQRCDPTILSDVTNRKGPRQTDSLVISPNDGPDAIIDLIINAQARRMDEQRANLILPGLHDRDELLQKLSSEQRTHSEIEGATEMDDHLYELVLRSQSERINEQRSELGGRQSTTSQEESPTPSPSPQGGCNAVTIPEDDITALVMRMQAGRIEEQRAHLHPSPTN